MRRPYEYCSLCHKRIPLKQGPFKREIRNDTPKQYHKDCYLRILAHRERQKHIRPELKLTEEQAWAMILKGKKFDADIEAAVNEWSEKHGGDMPDSDDTYDRIQNKVEARWMKKGLEHYNFVKGIDGTWDGSVEEAQRAIEEAQIAV